MSALGRLHRRAMQALSAADEPPARRAAALALGVFMGFSPFLGVQVLVGMTLATLLRVNRVLVFVGLCANLPWFAVPYYVGVTELAARALGLRAPSHLGSALNGVLAHSVVSATFWRELVGAVRPLLWPFALGSTTAATLLAVTTWVVAVRLAERADRRRAAQR